MRVQRSDRSGNEKDKKRGSAREERGILALRCVALLCGEGAMEKWRPPMFLTPPDRTANLRSIGLNTY
jgi:hypothetical protein